MPDDVVVVDHGSVAGFALESPAARAWVEESVVTECWQWLGATLVVDQRLVYQLVVEMRDEGLSVWLKP